MSEPCDLCQDWPGGVFEMSRPCCVARWAKRQPPHFDKRAYADQVERERGRAFREEVRAMWEKVE